MKNVPFPPLVRWVAVAAGLFGILSIFSGGSVLFGPASAQESAGDFVPFVVWFNFIAGFVYVLAAAAFWVRPDWALPLAWAIAAATALVALGFGVVALLGTPVELRTALALVLRFAVWAGLATWATRKRA